MAIRGIGSKRGMGAHRDVVGPLGGILGGRGVWVSGG